MKDVEKKSFNLSGFLVLISTVAGLGLPITGLANHMLQMTPPCLFSRHAAMAAHTILGILFMASTVSHAVLNRHILLNHVRGHASRPGITREALSAVVLVGIMLFVAVSHAFH